MNPRSVGCVPSAVAIWSLPSRSPGIDEIDVFVGLHAVADLRFGGGLLFAFEFLDPGAEVAGFAPDGLQENQRRGGMRAANGIDESVETFVDDLGAGIRETVEDEGVGFDAGQIRCEFGLHGALSAETQIDAVKSRGRVRAATNRPCLRVRPRFRA